MKIKLQVYLKGLRKEMNRVIHVNDNISIEKFCQYVIVSMNGNCKHLYQLILNDEETYLGPGCDIINSDEEFMEDKKMEELGLYEGDKLLLNYDFRSDWDFMIRVISVKKGYYEDDFKVISGCGAGIVEDAGGIEFFKMMVQTEMSEIQWKILTRDFPFFKGYDPKKFDVDFINTRINEFLDKYYEYSKPKTYEMYVTLDGFEKEIKRKISVESSLSLNDFCKCIISSMRGDLSHLYAIKKGKEFIDDEILDEEELNYLELQKGQRLKVIYDFGDSWEFNIRVSKVIDGYTEDRRFKVLSGKGYGIIDDCGGTGRLYEIFQGENTDWGEYDINEFDLNKINRKVDLCY